MFSQEAVGCTHGMSKTFAALPGTRPWASLPHLPGHSLQVRGLNWGFFSKVGKGWGRVGGDGEVTQLQQSGLFSKKNHI